MSLYGSDAAWITWLAVVGPETGNHTPETPPRDFDLLADGLSVFVPPSSTHDEMVTATACTVVTLKISGKPFLKIPVGMCSGAWIPFGSIQHSLLVRADDDVQLTAEFRAPPPPDWRSVWFYRFVPKWAQTVVWNVFGFTFRYPRFPLKREVLLQFSLGGRRWAATHPETTEGG